MLRPYRHQLFCYVLAIACTVGAARPQEFRPRQAIMPLVLDRREAAKLAVDKPPPQYPPIAKVNYLQGKVKLEVTTNEVGHVVGAHVLDGSALLAVSALKAVRLWKYHPVLTPAGPTGFATVVEIVFRLRFGAMQDLPPKKAEQDFLRSMVPSQVLRPDPPAPKVTCVHARLLIDDHGQIMDRQFPSLDRAVLETASRTLQDWTFRPAYWGSLPVASYVEVDVPVGAPVPTRTATIFAIPLP